MTTVPGPADVGPADVGPVDVGSPDPERIAVATAACPLVAGLNGGPLGGVATYLPRRRVTGVRVGPAGVDVHVTALYPATIREVDTQLRAALAPHLGGLPLAITVEDYAAPVISPSELLARLKEQS